MFPEGDNGRALRTFYLTLQGQQHPKGSAGLKRKLFWGYSVYFVWFSLGCFPFLLSEPLKLLMDIRQMNAMLGEPGEQLGSRGCQSRGGGCQSLSAGCQSPGGGCQSLVVGASLRVVGARLWVADASLWVVGTSLWYWVPVSGTWWECEELSSEHSYPLVSAQCVAEE